MLPKKLSCREASIFGVVCSMFYFKLRNNFIIYLPFCLNKFSALDNNDRTTSLTSCCFCCNIHSQIFFSGMNRYELTFQPVKINLNKLSSSLLFMVRSCTNVTVTFYKDQSKLVEYTIEQNKVIFYIF